MRLDLTFEEKHKTFNNGEVLIERKMGTIIFQLGNKYYTTSKRRKGTYSLKSSWLVHKNSGLLYKLY